jgi:hypothetical protein
VDTLAGYVAARIGRVPLRGEIIPGPGRFELEVLDADPRRVKKLKIFLSFDRRPGVARDNPRPLAPSGATAGGAPSTQPELPVASDASLKLSPDDTRSKDKRPT